MFIRHQNAKHKLIDLLHCALLTLFDVGKHNYETHIVLSEYIGGEGAWKTIMK